MAAPKTIENVDALEPQSLARWLSNAQDDGVGLCAVCGVAPAQLHEQLPDLRNLLRQRDLVLLTVDPAGIFSAARTLSQALESYVLEIERLGAMTEPIGEMLAWMHMQERWQGLSANQQDAPSSPLDSMGRLWQLLSEAAPAILIVFQPEQMTAPLREQLDYLTRFYYSDPIAEIAPEYGGQARAQGAIVLVTAARELPHTLRLAVKPRTLDVYEHVEQHMRDYFARPEVIAKLIESTQGDLSRLDELIVDLSQNIHLLSRHRYLQLEGAESSLIELLAIAQDPLEMTLAQRALAELEPELETPLPMLVRSLIERGLLTRSVKAGTLSLFLRDRQLGASIVDRLSTSSRQRCYQALCQASLQAGAELDVSRTVAWAIEAGALDIARRYAMQAAQQLFAQGEHQRALELLDALYGQLDPESDAILLAQLCALQVELASRLGRYRRALEYSQRLEHQTTGARGYAELASRQARLLLRINEHQRAVDLLSDALTQLHENELGNSLIALRVSLLLGEAFYERGDHERSQQRADEALNQLQRMAREQSLRPAELSPVTIQARNLSGKLAIFFGHFDRAKTLFSQNLEDAKRLGLSDEQARAMGNLGIVAMCLKDYEDALSCLKEAVAYQAASEIIPRARLLLNLGVIYQHRFEYELALKHYLEAMRVARQNEQSRIYAISAYNLATLYRDIGALERAEHVMDHLLRDSLTNAEASAMLDTWSVSLQLNIAYHRGQFKRVLELAREHQDLESRKDLRVPTGLLLIALAHAEEGDWSKARELGEHVTTLEGFQSPLAQARYTTLQARLAMLDGQLDEAQRLISQSIECWRSYGHFIEGLQAELLMIELLRKQQRQAELVARLSRLSQELQEHHQLIPSPLRQGAWGRSWPVLKLIELLKQENLPIPAKFAPPSTQLTMLDRSDARWQAWRQRYGAIVGESPRLYQIFRVLDRVAASTTPLLVLGESGTGKELIAQATHELSDRHGDPFIKVNCAAFVENLLMSELFGHEKGAFTGAVAQKVGRFELANGGTLFLDEIADISMQTQVALLRVLQEQEFERVGGTETLRVNVRLICATNKNLEEMVQRGEFRLDLYYRLKGMIIELPALRERREDIPRLIDAFTQRFTRSGDQPKRYEPEVLRRLVSYSWPGNVRELQNFVRSVLLFVEGPVVREEHLTEMEDFFLGGAFSDDVPSLDQIIPDRPFWEEPVSVYATGAYSPVAPKSQDGAQPRSTDTPAPLAPSNSDDLTNAMIQHILDQQVSLHDLKKNLEIESIRRAILETDGNVTQAAKILQMKRPRLSQIINSTPELSELKDRLIQ